MESRNLVEILNAKTLKVLQQTAQRWNVPCSRRKNKTTLVPALIQRITQDPMRLLEDLVGMDECSFGYFSRATEGELPEGGEDLRLRKTALLRYPYIDIRWESDVLVFDVPEEIRKLYERVYSSSFINSRCRMDYLVRNMNAAVRLYGVITLEELVEIFNAYNENSFDQEDCHRTSERELFHVAQTRRDAWDSAFEICSNPVRHHKTMLVDRVELGSVDEYGTWMPDVTLIQDILDARRGLTRYCPDYGEYLRCGRCDLSTEAMEHLRLLWTSYGHRENNGVVEDAARRQPQVEASLAMRELTLALLFLSRFRERPRKGQEQPWSAWKGYDFDVLNELYDRDLIRGSFRSKSVVLSQDGMAEARRILAKYGIEDWPSLRGADA